MKNEKDKIFDCIVIGAGASGLVAAAKAAKLGINVALLERNNAPGKKLYATGNGRCNYLNMHFDEAKELKKELESFGIIGDEEAEGRVYPKSREAKSVVEALEKSCKKAGVNIFNDSCVASVQKNEQGFVLKSRDGKSFYSKTVIVCTGGKAGIQYGCYGDGYMWAGNFGHKIIKPIPALVALIPEDNIESLHGVRCIAKVSFLKNEKEYASYLGEVQFTKDSISGICVMNCARYYKIDSPEDKFELVIDFFPKKDEGQIESMLNNQKEIFGFPLKGLLPEKLADYIEKNNKHLDYLSLAEKLKHYTFNLKGTKGWADAQCTRGGISFAEIKDNQESKLVSGLFFAGEICDYDGLCGGYNLSYAFQTGLRAGEGAFREVKCQAGQKNNK